MIIFDEKKYAEDILRNGYQTKKNQGLERCCLIRYFRYKGLSDQEIIKELDKIPFERRKYLKREEILYIYKRLLNKSSEFNFIYDIEVTITKSDKTFLSELDKDVSFLAYVYLVYYKWALNIKHLVMTYKGKQYVEYNEKDLWKLASLSNKKVIERYNLDNKLLNCGFLDLKIFKSKTFLCINKIGDDDIEQVLNGIKINHLKDAFKVLMAKRYQNCFYKQCEVCGRAFVSLSPSGKYCDNCKTIVRLEQVNKGVQKTKNKQYTLYKHVTPSDKIYIGITSQKPEERWNMGEGYKTQKYFYNAIKKYGWNNIQHIIIKENLNYNDACKLEKEFIKKYKSNKYNYGYNISSGGSPSIKNSLFSNNQENIRVQKILSLLNKGYKLDKIHQIVKIYELEYLINSGYTLEQKMDLIPLYVYYILMRDLNKVLEDGYVYVYPNTSIYKYTIRILKKYSDCIEYKNIDNEYYFKVLLGKNKDFSHDEICFHSLKNVVNTACKNNFW